MRASWNNVTLAESDGTIVTEGNHYFPPGSVKQEYLEQCDTYTFCPWKGQASYSHIIVDGKRNDSAAWYYPDPKVAAKEIKNYVAFWRGVEIVA
jgi:uncharacterized protein (DUF427 family)